MRPSSAVFIPVVLMLGGAIFAASWSDRRTPDYLAKPLETISSNIAGWTAAGVQDFDERVVTRLRPTSYLSRVYEKQRRQLGFVVVFYAQQRAGEAMHSPKHCLPGSGWEIWKHGSVTVPVGPRRVRINKYSIQNAGSRMLVFYWYQSRERIIADEYLGKLYLVHDALFGGRTAASIVRITVRDTPQDEADGAAFSAAVIPQVQTCFGGALSVE